MPSTNSLVKRLLADYPNLQFVAGERFMWSPAQRTVHVDINGSPALLFHELAHALLGHADYSRDVELVAMERAAWDKALELAPAYDVVIEDDTVEDHLDTYRDWLHARSTCPNCTATGLQTAPRTYHCLACDSEWRVNDARICALRRYQTKTSAR